MKLILNILMGLSIVLSANMVHAQIKNAQTETVKIFGNCGMCKTNIEKAGNIKNTANVTWDKDTKMAEINFDSKKTDRDEILKRIALAGYDNDQFLAPVNAYAQLAECCQYERLNKAPAMVMTESNLEMEMHEPKMETNMPPSENHTDMAVPEPKGEMNMPAMESHTDMVMPDMVNSNPLEEVFDTYFAINDALVKTNATTAKAKAAELLNVLKALNIEMLKTEVQAPVTKVLPSLIETSKSISETKDISKQREKFKTLSRSMHKIISFYNSKETLYYQYCPMQDANWLSKDKAIKNPYYGSQMLSCGSTVETIKNKN